MNYARDVCVIAYGVCAVDAEQGRVSENMLSNRSGQRLRVQKLLLLLQAAVGNVG